MNGGVFLAGRPRKNGHTRIQQVIASHLQAGCATAEDPRKELCESSVNLIKGIFEALSGLFVDFANRGLQGLECRLKIGILSIEILFSLRRLGMLINGRQVDRAQAINASCRALDLCLPLSLRGVIRQCRSHLLRDRVTPRNLLLQRLEAHRGLCLL